MKILNLYAGIGGNRRLWGNEHKIIAVEINESICQIYQDLYPNDTVICDDAHEYLIKNFRKFDFIWASPPCQTHSKLNFLNAALQRQPRYPNMVLYEEIIFLQNYFKDGKWIVENVVPYYEALIPAQKIGRHLFWSNFKIPYFDSKSIKIKNQAGHTAQKRSAFGYKSS